MTELETVFGLQPAVVFDEQQEQAIREACDPDRRLVAITGPAGSGKTLLMKEIAKRLSAVGYTVQASAPTGKAAKRIRELTGLEAMTNHRMLGYGQPLEHEETDDKTGDTRIVRISTGPRFTKTNQLPYDVLLCDEYAMVSTTMHRDLIDALKAGARIRMFGDVNQLKPIEEGWQPRDKPTEPSPFQVALTKFGGIELKTIHRTAVGSDISENAAAILKGRLPKRLPDFGLQFTSEPVRTLQEHVRASLDGGIDYSTPDHQIITVTNKGAVGTRMLNQTLQSMFWDRTRPPLDLPRHTAFDKKEQPQLVRVQIGTKVVCTGNHYDLGDEEHSYAFNGEIGIITDIDWVYGSLTVDFGDRVVVIPPLIVTETKEDKRTVIKERDPRKDIDLAYVLTVHKMQGSECRHVTVVLNRSSLWMQSRRSLYTAVTRAREVCTLVTDMPSLTKSVKGMD